MVQMNVYSLLEVALVGEIAHLVVGGSYMTGWHGKPFVGLGRSDTVYNVKVGDPYLGGS